MPKHYGLTNPGTRLTRSRVVENRNLASRLPYAATYLGRTRPRTERVDAEGRAISDRTINKLLRGEQGRRYAAARLAAAGGLEALSTLRHPGKHRYAFGLSRRGRGLLPPPLPFPKQIDV
jgi:hypothetical protein